MHRVAVFIGTRSEAIKMAPVVMALKGARELDHVVITAIHDGPETRRVLDRFGIDVHMELDVARANQPLAALTARTLEAIDTALSNLVPDLSLGHGGTTVACCAALASFYRRVPFGHVEAGLQTSVEGAMLPEEANRTLASQLATLHFAPSEAAGIRLRRAGRPVAGICVTGDTVVDALDMELLRQTHPHEQRRIQSDLRNYLGLRDTSRPYVLVSAHRRENFGRGIDEICAAIEVLANHVPGVDFIYPVHPNPNVEQPVVSRLGEIPSVKLLPLQPYLNFVYLMKEAYLILTDSGGVQEEAARMGKPTLILRSDTEHPEGIDAGAARLVGTNATAIVAAVEELIRDGAAYGRMTGGSRAHGDGHAAARIIQGILQFFRGRQERTR